MLRLISCAHHLATNRDTNVGFGTSWQAYEGDPDRFETAAGLFHSTVFYDYDVDEGRDYIGAWFLYGPSSRLLRSFRRA